MSALDLPNELYLQIFGLLSRQTVYKCMFVCKYWYTPAIEAFYTNLTLTGNSVMYLKSKVLYQPESQNQQLDHGYRIKTLKIGRDFHRDSAKFTNEEFYTLLSYMPNLTTLHFLSSSNFDFYMTALYNIDEENLRNLQVIAAPKDDTLTEDVTLSFAVCCRFYKSLTDLTLYVSNYEYIMNGVLGTSLNFLPNFKNLTHLTVDNTCANEDTTEYDKGDLVIFQILGACPKLTSFVYYNNFPGIPREEAAEYEVRAEEAIIASKPHENKYLKHVVLGINYFTKTFIKYFTKYTPSHLDTFKLDMEGPDFDHWVEENNLDTVMQFATHLGSVKNLKFHIGLPREDVQKPYDMQTAMNRYWMFIGALKGNRDLYTRAIYSVSEYHKRREFGVTVQDNNTMSFECPVYTPEYLVRNSMTGVSSFFFPVPESKVGPWIINELKVLMLQNLKGIGLHILKYMLVNCQQLGHLNLESPHNSSFGFSASGSEGYKGGTKKLTELSVSNVTLSANLLNLVSTYLPNTKSLSAAGCDLVKDGGMNNNATLNLTGFKHLETFYVDIRSMNIKSFDYIFVGLDYVDAEDDVDYYKIEMLDKENINKKKYRFTSTTVDFINEYKGRASTLNVQFSSKPQEIYLRDHYSTVGSLPIIEEEGVENESLAIEYLEEKPLDEEEIDLFI